MSDKPDSPLWTTPASKESAFPELADFDPGLIEQMAYEMENDPEFQRELRERLAPYETRVTAETLYKVLP